MRGGKVQHVGGTEWLMDYDDEDLKNTISHLTDEQLVRMLTVDSSEYRKEALEFAEAEVKARNVSLSELPQEISNPANKDRGGEFSPAPELDLASSFAQSRARSLPAWLLFSTLDKDLKKNISHLTNEQLIRMLTVDSGEYRKEALQFAEAEITARGISLWEGTQQGSNPAVQEQQIQVSPGYPPDINSPSPFEHFRARSLPIWSFLALLLIGLKDTFLTRYTTFGTRGSILFQIEFDAVIAAWICWQCLRHKIDSDRLLGLIPRDLNTWAFVGLAIPLLALDAGTSWLTRWLRYYLISLFGSNPVTNWLGSSSEIGFRLEFWIIVRTFMTVAYGPAIEEIVFRGLLLHRWAQKWGLKAAVLGTSLAFALIHPRPIGPFIFGLVMAVLYLRTRSLWVPIACHATYNALVVTCQTFECPRLNGAFCFVVAVPAFLLFLHKYWPDQETPLPYFDRLASVGEARDA